MSERDDSGTSMHLYEVFIIALWIATLIAIIVVAFGRWMAHASMTKRIVVVHVCGVLVAACAYVTEWLHWADGDLRRESRIDHSQIVDVQMGVYDRKGRPAAYTDTSFLDRSGNVETVRRWVFRGGAPGVMFRVYVLGAGIGGALMLFRLGWSRVIVRNDRDAKADGASG